MYKHNKKIVIIMVLLIISSTAIISGADSINSIKAQIASKIKVFYNGTQTDLGIDPSSGKSYQPLLVDGRVYLPVRALANIFGKDIQWEDATSMVKMYDKYDGNYTSVLTQLINEKQKVATLEARIKELEAQLTEVQEEEVVKENNITTLSQLEVYLNDEYELYRDVEFDIEVSGSKSNIDIEIYVHKDDNTLWKKFTERQVETYIKNIVTDVQEYFPKAGIDGYIENDRTGIIEYEFYTNSKGNVVIY